METDSRAVVALITAPASDADTIARALVEARLAACVNIIPRVSSIYRWQGEVETADEALLLVNTTAEAIGRIESLLRDGLHPYETFELIALPVVSGSSKYLEWLIANSRDIK